LGTKAEWLSNEHEVRPQEVPLGYAPQEVPSSRKDWTELLGYRVGVFFLRMKPCSWDAEGAKMGHAGVNFTFGGASFLMSSQKVAEN